MDMQGRKCDRCRKGIYKKNFVYEGKVTCSRCGHITMRIRPKKVKNN